MDNSRYVFSQITDFLPKRVFDTIVKKYDGDKYVRHFSCWNQMLCMIFGQLTNRDSLRDLALAIDAHRNKAYHLGLGKSVTRSNLAKANEHRNSLIFEEFAFQLIDRARKLLANEDFEIKGKIYAFDSSIVKLCLSVFWWAKYNRDKGGIKLHTLYDINTQIPAFVHITAANINDPTAMDQIPYEKDAYYIFDRGYTDFSRLHKITQIPAYYVIRAKSNLNFRRIYSRKVNKSAGIKCDHTGVLTQRATAKLYPQKLRRIKFYDQQQDRVFVFLTNNFELDAEQIALLYKQRWQVELFFKWIKQHLKIKSFWGKSENAVKIQIYTAISAYCLVAIVGKELKIDRSTYEILQILGFSLLDKTPVIQLLTSMNYNNFKEPICNQLKISFI